MVKFFPSPFPARARRPLPATFILVSRSSRFMQFGSRYFSMFTARVPKWRAINRAGAVINDAVAAVVNVMSSRNNTLAPWRKGINWQIEQSMNGRTNEAAGQEQMLNESAIYLPICTSLVFEVLSHMDLKLSRRVARGLSGHFHFITHSYRRSTSFERFVVCRRYSAKVRDVEFNSRWNIINFIIN